MFLRVDSGEEKVQRVEGLNKDFLSKFKLIIISDYNKGFLLEEDIKFICDNHSQVFIDTKKNLGDFCNILLTFHQIGSFSPKLSWSLDSLFSGNLEAVQRRRRKVQGGCRVGRAKQRGGAK